MAVQGWTPVTGNSVGCMGAGGRAQVCNGDPFYSGDLISSRRMGSDKENWEFWAQKIVELSPGPEGCRGCGKHLQQPGSFHPAASSPSANLQPHCQVMLASPAQRPPWAGLCASSRTTHRSSLAVEAFPADLLPFSTRPDMAVPAQASCPTFAQHGSLRNTSPLCFRPRKPRNSSTLHQLQRSAWASPLVPLRFRFIIHVVTGVCVKCCGNMGGGEAEVRTRRAIRGLFNILT